MSTAKFTILKSRHNKSQRHPIVIRLTSGKIQKYIFSGYYCSKNEWDEETESVTSEYKLKNPKITQINAYLIKQKARVQEIHEQFIIDGISDYTKNQFVSMYSKEERAKTTVLKAFLKRINELNKLGSVGYSNVFKSVFGVFSTFSGKASGQYARLLHNRDKSIMKIITRLNQLFKQIILCKSTIYEPS